MFKTYLLLGLATYVASIVLDIINGEQVKTMLTIKNAIEENGGGMFLSFCAVIGLIAGILFELLLRIVVWPIVLVGNLKTIVSSRNEEEA